MVPVTYLEAIDMTIKKQWVLIMTLISILAIAINSFIFSVLIDKYFMNYIQENYKENLEEIQQYAHYYLNNNIPSSNHSDLQLQKYLDDPIIQISIYDHQGKLVLSVGEPSMGRHGMMMGRDKVEERDNYDLTDADTNLGTLIITRHGNLQDSIASTEFKSTLLLNSLISGVIVLSIAILVSLFISKKMGRDLINTSNYAKSLDMNEDTQIIMSGVKEISDIQKSLKLMSQKLKLKQKSRKQKIDILMHESRTPLTILKSQLEAANDGIIIMDKQRIENCIIQVDQLSKMLGNITDVIETNPVNEKINITRFDVVEICQKTLKGFKMQFERKNIHLKYEGENKFIIFNDQYLISKILYNLLTNSYKFTPEDGEVIVSVEKKWTNYFKLTVKDNGIGINEKEIEHIFDAYFRSKNNLKEEGQGLGLYMVKNNIELLQGKISVKSLIGKGTEFEIILPISLE